MKVLFVSLDLSGADLAFRLQEEGNEVRFFVDDRYQKSNYKNILNKVKDWRNELKWVGKEGLIVFDSVGYGKEQDKLRKQGYSVIGGSEAGDKLEHDRQYCKKVFASCGIPVIPSKNFTSIDESIEYIKKNKGPWVVKQNGHADKIFNYVGDFEDGRDVIEVLKNYYKYQNDECSSIDIQKKALGIEIGVARYFNGQNWVGPIELNVEY
jgi:phosphoribosylamine--glycine ligase